MSSLVGGPSMVGAWDPGPSGPPKSGRAADRCFAFTAMDARPA